MQIEVSVKNPTRGGWSTCPASPATSSSRPYSECSLIVGLLRTERRVVRGLQVRLLDQPADGGDPGAGLRRHPGPAAVPLDVGEQVGAARPAPRPDVAGGHLRLLD